MMPLKSNVDEKEEKKLSTETLNTQEILSLLSKTSQDFKKDVEFSQNFKNLYKKKTLNEIAERNKINKNKGSRQIDEKNKSDELKKEEKKEEESSERIKNDQKMYSEEQTKKYANDLAKDYYNKGYQLGVKKTKEELEKGDKVLAVALKNVTDNIFALSPEVLKKIMEQINFNILESVKEILGYEIDNKTEFFIEKLKKLAGSIEDSTKKIIFFLNEKDYESISIYLKNNKISLNYYFQIDKNLNRGELRIKSGSIEVNEILDKKIDFPSSDEIEKNLSTIKEENEK
jgi:flagellar biosynthesis/type III secretory pathway protein FliH